LKIVTFNINNINKRLNNLVSWLEKAEPDVVCLQELKVEQRSFPAKLGMRDILAARRIRLYCAAGERHRAIFRIAVAGEVSTDYPVTLVQGHPDAEVLTDEATARPIEVGLF
jgi:6-phosphogluconolactonase/glucosamine-6-phosphate isomerase/deaminase